MFLHMYALAIDRHANAIGGENVGGSSEFDAAAHGRSTRLLGPRARTVVVSVTALCHTRRQGRCV